MRDTETMTTDGHQQPMTWTLADLRKAAKLTQAEVAKRMGVNQPRVSQIEKDFPNLHYQVVANYLCAIDSATVVAVKDVRVTLNNLRSDPRSIGAQMNRALRSAEGMVRLAASAAAEELPLEQGEPHPGSDDTGRNIDQPDAESDERDREDC